MKAKALYTAFLLILFSLLISMQAQVPPLPVLLDVKPGSCPNPINVKSMGFVSVAILGTAGFDVRQINISSVKLEGVSPKRSNIEDVSAPPENNEVCACSTIVADGFKDLVLKFEAEDLAEALGAVHDGDIIPVYISGSMADGTAFIGQDCVTIVKKKYWDGMDLDYFHKG